MKDHSGCTRKFSQLSRAWYSQGRVLDINKTESFWVGLYTAEGGTSGEFEVAWVDIGGRIVPKLCAVNDSWSALSHFRDLLEKMAHLDSETVTPQEFREILLDLDIEDKTRIDEPL